MHTEQLQGATVLSSRIVPTNLTKISQFLYSGKYFKLTHCGLLMQKYDIIGYDKGLLRDCIYHDYGHFTSILAIIIKGMSYINKENQL